MVTRRILSGLVALALALAPAGVALAQACAAAEVDASPASCCCAAAAGDACTSMRVSGATHGCPCSARDDAPLAPTVPPAPAGERPAPSSAGSSIDEALAIVGLASCVPDSADRSALSREGAAAGARPGAASSLFVLDCVYRL